MTDLVQPEGAPSRSQAQFFEKKAAALADMMASELQPVDAAYAKVLRIATLLSAVPVAVGATVLDMLVIRSAGGPVGLLTTAAWLLLLICCVVVPSRRYARIGYALGEAELRVARGYFFRVDTVVPFVRVQHIDVGQGPVERRYGLSHLVVHTSGTHNSTVTLPGLPSDQAATMRDVIRGHIQSDFA